MIMHAPQSGVGSQHDRPHRTGRKPRPALGTTVNPSFARFAYCASAFANMQVKVMVGRTYHDTNYSVLVAGDPLQVRLRRSRVVMAAE
jgi:hypothetical protein